MAESRFQPSFRGVAHQMRRGMLCLLALTVYGVGTSLTPATGQEQADAPSAWKDVELSPEFKELLTALKANGPFNDAARGFLEASILPQLESDANRSTLDEIRKKIRDRFLLSIGNEQAFTQASTLVRDKMNDLSRNAKADPFVRVQAMLLVGDLVDKARLPWTPALETLAAAAQDASLAPGVRVAAMVGLANHVNVLARLPAEQAAKVRESVSGVLAGILSSAPEAGKDGATATRPVATVWMAARGLAMLPQVMNPAMPDMAAKLVAVLGDASWPVDVRVRAAAALGRMAGKESGIDGSQAVAAIKKLAIVALESDRAEAKQQIERRAYTGGAGQPAFQPRQPMPPMGVMPGGQPSEDGLRETVCRRAAWRLYTLGDAIDPKATKGGLAPLLDKDGAEAKRLASVLKEAGEALDAGPYGDNLLAALNALDPAGAKKRADEAAKLAAAEPEADMPAEPGNEADPKAPADKKPSPKPGDSPFGESPFGK